MYTFLYMQNEKSDYVCGWEDFDGVGAAIQVCCSFILHLTS